jgi:hypothetical protein
VVVAAISIVVVFESKFSFDVHEKHSKKSSSNGRSNNRIKQFVIPRAASSKKGQKLEVFLAVVAATDVANFQCNRRYFSRFCGESIRNIDINPQF